MWQGSFRSCCCGVGFGACMHSNQCIPRWVCDQMNSLNKYEMLMVKMLSALPPKLLSKESVRCFWLVSHQFNSASVIISSITRQQRLFSLWEHRSQSLINPENSTDVTAVPCAEQKRHTLSALILTNWKLHSFYLELLKSSCCCCFV